MTKPGKTLKSDELAHPSSFCGNKKCADYWRVDAGNLRKFGFTRKGRQRWQCTTCKKVFAETRGTVFHGKKHDVQTIIECFAMLAERNSLAAIHRIKGVKEETVSAWLLEAASQMVQIEEALLRDYKMSRAQLDALWTYIYHKGEKGGARKSPNMAHSGAGRRSIPIRGYESGGRSPRTKKRSRSN